MKVKKTKLEKGNLLFLINILFVCLLFIPLLNREWLIYDERILYENTYFPVVSNLGDVFEIINKFGLNFNVISSNQVYSSNYVFRACPFSQLLGMICSFFFKTNAFYYHLFLLALHLMNCLFLFHIIKHFTNHIYACVLTLIWSIHPVNLESILLSTNFGAIFSYMFFFGFILDFIKNRKNNFLISRMTFIPIIYLIPMLTNEYIVTLPLVIFIISFFINYKNNALDCIKISLKESFPYFIGLSIYVIYFFLSNYQVTHQNNFKLLDTIQRVFWLSPQIFFHDIKLIFFPNILTVDQSLYIKLGKTLTDSYFIFCFIFLLCWLSIPILFIKKKFGSLSIFIMWGFFFSLLPFLHIFMPSYTLTAERYLYTPTAILCMGFAIFFNSTKWNKKYFLSVFLILFILCFSRSLIRVNEWKDNYRFIFSAYSKSDLLTKAIKHGMCGYALTTLKKDGVKAEEEYKKAIKLLTKAKKEILNKKERADDLAILKNYGLDKKSIFSKIISIEANLRINGLKENNKKILELFKPYEKNLESLDPKAIELYVSLLLKNNEQDKAKNILLKSKEIYRNMPVILIALFKYYFFYEHDIKISEKYLLEAYKHFPYDTNILFNSFAFYKETKNFSEAARFAYLYGLRLHSEFGYKNALENYLEANDLKNALITINKLSKIQLKDPDTLFFISKYFYKIGDIKNAIVKLEEGYYLCKRLNNNPLLTFDTGRTLSKLYFESGNKEQAIFIAKDIFPYATTSELKIKLAKLYKLIGLQEV